MNTTFTLEGRGVRLEPLTLEHVPALMAAQAEGRETYAVTNVPASEAEMRAYVARAVEDSRRGLAAPFATIDLARNRVVGSTRFGNFEFYEWPREPEPPLPLGPDAVEIGWTWLAASAQRTHVNTEAKVLMLRHAFEVWRVRRVMLMTDVKNLRSRANIERIGGKLDGVLRAHRPAQYGGLRDTARYSILADEWPGIRERLLGRLERARAG